MESLARRNHCAGINTLAGLALSSPSLRGFRNRLAAAFGSSRRTGSRPAHGEPLRTFLTSLA